jgi:type I restriction enzyme S subunit
MLIKNNFLDLDKSNWELSKLGDLAIEILKRIDNPSESKNDRFVGLDNFVSGDISIKNWVTTKNLSSAAKEFKAGDVLFARRNPYLRRASVVNFNGCCSGDAFVLRENNEKIVPGFLSFIVNSSRLWDYAITNAAGTMSKRVKWRDLSKYELLLPPKNEQKKLAELLIAINKIIENNFELKKKYTLFYDKYLNDTISGRFSNNTIRWDTHIFGKLGETFGGLVGKTKNDFGEGKPFVTYMNIFKNSKVNPNEFEKVMISENEKQNELKFGDILFTGSSETPQEVGMSSVLLDKLKGYYLNSFCFGFRLYNFDTLLPEYARYLLRSNHVRSFMYKHAQGSTRFNLSKTTVRTKLQIKIPDIIEQKEIYEKLDLIEKKILEIDDTLNKSLNLQKSLINKIF